MSNSMNIPLLLSLLLNRTKIPKDFHERATAIEEMLEDDSSGLVDSLTDFMVESACVDITIETGNENLNEILNEKWLAKLNKKYRGQGIEIGIKGLLKEYLKERWKGASFPVLKIVAEGDVDGVEFPTAMMFVDGGSIYAKDKDEKDKKATLLAYNYYVGTGEDEKIDGEAYFMYKIGCRWFTKYPTPFLIRRGIYKNWQIINNLKSKELKLLDQIIPYIMEILKGSEALAINKDVTYGTDELKEVKVKIQELIDELKEKELSITGTTKNKVPARVVNFDEEIKHIIPDLINLFKTELFASAEKNILGGLGFIDIAEGVSVSRRESILNPKAFIKEVNSAIEDFKLILNDIVDLIKEKNSDENEDTNHPKYTALKWKIVSEKVTDFMTDDFLERCRALSDRGLLSNKTIAELHGQDYELERIRREKELTDGDDALMYPKPINNQEDKGIDLREMDNTPEGQIMCECPKCGNQIPLPEGKHCNEIKCDKCKTTMRRLDRPGKGKEKRSQDNPDKKVLDDRKPGSPEAQKFNQAKMELTGAPYANVKDLPSRVTNNMGIGLQRVFMRVFNQAYKKYRDDTRASKIAWSVITKIAKKSKEGKWVKNKSMKLTKSMFTDTIQESLKEGDKL